MLSFGGRGEVGEDWTSHPNFEFPTQGTAAVVKYPLLDSKTRLSKIALCEQKTKQTNKQKKLIIIIKKQQSPDPGVKSSAKVLCHTIGLNNAS